MTKDNNIKDKKNNYLEAVGRRKESVARVRVYKSSANELSLIHISEPTRPY